MAPGRLSGSIWKQLLVPLMIQSLLTGTFSRPAPLTSVVVKFQCVGIGPGFPVYLETGTVHIEIGNSF
ncbi:hypothetical protein QYF36_014468 [Acer negundo]|nr:hypothetical protein QYF36_014468 [Acer negundo]